MRHYRIYIFPFCDRSRNSITQYFLLCKLSHYVRIDEEKEEKKRRGRKVEETEEENAEEEEENAEFIFFANS